MLAWAAERGMLSGLGLHDKVPRASIFADDTIIFFKPRHKNHEVILCILKLFGDASGLHINLQKSTITCIGCSWELAREVADHLL